MDSWSYYNRLQQQATQQPDFQQYTSAANAQHILLAHQQLRQVAERAEQQQQQQHQQHQQPYSSLPPSLVHAAAASKQTQQQLHLHQQALANMRGGTVSVAGMRENIFVSNSLLPSPPPPQTSTSPAPTWKGSSNGSGIVIPEPRLSTSSSSSRSQCYGSDLSNGTGGGARPAIVVRQAVELKTSQPIFPGQPPPLARVTNKQYNGPQPPPRQSLQLPSRNSQEFREPFIQQQQQQQGQPPQQLQAEIVIQRQQQQSPQHHLVQQQQPSPQYYNNPSPQSVASPQGGYYQNPSPHSATDQYYVQQQQPQMQQQQQQSSKSRSSSSRQKSGGARSSKQSASATDQHLQQRQQQQQQQQQLQLQQQQQQQLQHQQLLQNQQRQKQLELQREKHLREKQLEMQQQQSSSQQDLGLARLGALGALTDLTDGNDLLSEVPSTINYEDLAGSGGFAVVASGAGQLSLSRPADKSASKGDQKPNWVSRAGELLDLTSGESSRVNTPHQESEPSCQPSSQHQQQSSGEGLITQIVMNPWDPNQAPMMTLAPLANAMQAYQQQWLSIKQAAAQGESGNNVEGASEEGESDDDDSSERPRVVCLCPEDDMGFLLNLPPPCNVLSQPSSVDLSGKPQESPFHNAFKKFLKGEVPPATRVEPEPDEATPVHELPGKKKYIPPYTPKSALRNSSSSPKTEPKSSLSIIPKHASSSVRGSRPSPAKSQPVSAASNGRSNTSTSSSIRSTNSQHLINSNKEKGKKASKAKDLSDDELFEAEIAVLPKRESSKRKAKDQSSTKRMLQEKLLAGDEEDDGLDLTDSDDDATWTPFKDKEREKNQMASPANPGASMQAVKKKHHEDSVDTEYEGGADSKRSKKAHSSGASGNAAASLVGNLVPDDHELQIGDFVLFTSDLDRESAPIWRLDSKTLLQRYNPTKGSDGECLYNAANMFTGFVPTKRDKYTSVAVKFISVENNCFTVQIVKRAGQPPGDSELWTRSRAETAQFQENFEVYIQALISQCLDSNFLDEVFNDQDEYFVSNIEKVDSVTLLRKDKVMVGVSLSLRFQQAISTWPCLNDLGSAAAQDTKCGACERDRASTVIQMYGQPYDSNTLKPFPPDEKAILNRNFSVCKKCSRLAVLFHRLHHQKQRMFTVCLEVVENRQKSNPTMDTTKILNELLANDKWLEQQFKKMQDVWADADTFVR